MYSFASTMATETEALEVILRWVKGRDMALGWGRAWALQENEVLYGLEEDMRCEGRA